MESTKSKPLRAADAASTAMSVWYRLAPPDACFVDASWGGGTVQQRMADQESARDPDAGKVSAITRDALDVLKHISLQGASLLDVGCGAGHWSRILAAAPHPMPTWRYTGLEIDAARVALCWKLHRGVDFAVGRAESPPFPDHSFDIALISGVVQYLSAWELALRAVSRVCTSYQAVFRIPVIKYRPTTHALQTARTAAGDEHHHLWLFNRDEFEQTATENGLRLVVRDYTDECARVEGLDERVFWLNYLFQRNPK